MTVFLLTECITFDVYLTYIWATWSPTDFMVGGLSTGDGNENRTFEQMNNHNGHSEVVCKAIPKLWLAWHWSDLRVALTKWLETHWDKCKVCWKRRIAAHLMKIIRHTMGTNGFISIKANGIFVTNCSNEKPLAWWRPTSHNLPLLEGLKNNSLTSFLMTVYLS